MLHKTFKQYICEFQVVIKVINNFLFPKKYVIIYVFVNENKHVIVLLYIITMSCCPHIQEIHIHIIQYSNHSYDKMRICVRVCLDGLHSSLYPGILLRLIIIYILFNHQLFLASDTLRG